LAEFRQFEKDLIELIGKLFHNLALARDLLFSLIPVSCFFLSVKPGISDFFFFSPFAPVHFGENLNQVGEGLDVIFEHFLFGHDGTEISRGTEFFLGIVLDHQRAFVNAFNDDTDHVQAHNRVHKKYHAVVLVCDCVVVDLFQDLEHVLNADVHVAAFLEVSYIFKRRG
jgi:hypothetical protein